MLIICPECGKEISDKSTQCIHCGCPLGMTVDNDLILKQLKNGKNFTAISYVMKELEVDYEEAKRYVKTIVNNNKEIIDKSKNIPKCPTCQSTNIRKIGSGERVASVVGLGLFSRKINKTWMCNNCKHTW